MRLHRRLAWLIALVAAALLGGALPALSAAPAQAATSLGSLALTPAVGGASTPFSLTTVSSGAKGCPVPSTNVQAIITGPGDWATKAPLLVSTDIGVSTTAEFTIPLADTLAGVAQSNALTIVAGKYTITLTCQDLFGLEKYGDFTASLWFTSPTAWQSTDPSAPTAVTTQTALAASPASTAALGAAVTLTATVTPSNAVGTVQFRDGATALGAPVAVASGTAATTVSSLAAGSRSLTAVFVPTSAAAFTTSTSAAVAYTITDPGLPPATATATVLGPVSPASAQVGDEVTLSATVTPPSAVGSVQFTDGGTLLGAPVPLVSGTASIVTTALPVGVRSLRASFVPADTDAFAPSASSTVSYTVSARPGPAVLGGLTVSPGSGGATSVLLITTVSSGAQKGCPVGATNVVATATGPGGWSTGLQIVGNTDVGVSSVSDFSIPLNDTLLGVAQSNGTVISVGRYDLTLTCRDLFGLETFGVFTGSIWFTTPTAFQSTNPVGSVVTTSVALTLSPADRADLGKPVTFTAAVSPADAIGTVKFVDTSTPTPTTIGTAAVVAGVASVRLSNQPLGLRIYRASFIPSDPARFSLSNSPNVIFVVAKPPPPANLTLPVMSGTVRQGLVVSCSPGTWANAPTALAYSWLRSGRLIAGATARTYRIVAADAGRALACRVTATNAGGSVYRQSASKTVPYLAASRLLRMPVVSGIRAVGRTLTSSTGAWSPTPKAFSYQWFVAGVAVQGATKRTFVVPRSAKGKLVSVRVRALRPGAVAGVVVVRAGKIL